MLAVITTNLWRQWSLYSLWLVADSLSAHSCDARTKDGESIGDVGSFDGAVFNIVVSHHFHELGISRVASHGLGLAGCNGIFDFMLGEAFIMLADNLYHGHSIHGLHVNVGESAAHVVLLGGR